MSLNTTCPVRLSDTFIQDSAYTYIEAESDRIAEYGGLRVRDECVHTGTRGTASGLRREVLALLPDLDGKLRLDFSGIERASSSFLDELLGRLVAVLGPEVFHSRIRVMNAPQGVVDAANVVIAQRLRTPGKEHP